MKHQRLALSLGDLLPIGCLAIHTPYNINSAPRKFRKKMGKYEPAQLLTDKAIQEQLPPGHLTDID